MQLKEGTWVQIALLAGGGGRMFIGRLREVSLMSEVPYLAKRLSTLPVALNPALWVGYTGNPWGEFLTNGPGPESELEHLPHTAYFNPDHVAEIIPVNQEVWKAYFDAHPDGYKEPKEPAPVLQFNIRSPEDS